MRHNLYRKILADDQSSARRREHDLFVDAIRVMRASDEAGNDGLKRIQAVHQVNRLWTALLTDLADPENRLPDELRASLISIGISVMRQLARICSRERDSFGSLIEIHSVIAEGLRAVKGIKIYLKANEKLYVNGAVIQVDRKVALELLNNATFLLENHVLQAKDATTPFRQLYFVVQVMMMEPADVSAPRALFGELVASLRDVLETMDLVDGLAQIEAQVREGNYFRALKTIRNLLPAEDKILAGNPLAMSAEPMHAAVRKMAESVAP